ncbi:hypothetical protein [Pontimicrobium sp. SW4]|uniref:Uncharacterized protein n=1 Tax=Pontimicrobium sp. SW4 TaxID=3153519 RepID=A0AAU7BX93_9FLAO
MVAEFYIIAESFEHNSNFTKEEIENKVKSLAQDFVYIKRYRDTNQLFVHPDIYNVNFIEDIPLLDLMFNEEIANKNLDRDVRLAIKKIIIESKETTCTSEEVIEVLLPEHDENKCHGLIGFNTVDSVEPEYQVVYNLNGWFQFRRHYLGLYPKDENFFLDECEKYFPNVVFHENNRNTIGAILDNFPKKIVYHLTALNDKFRESEDGIRHRTQVLDHFSGNCNLDETATLEGHAERKPYFTYDFRNDEKIMQPVCCEPHMKLSSSDVNGDNTYYQHRIYFHEGFENISNHKILVGHIGEHIKFE